MTNAPTLPILIRELTHERYQSCLDRMREMTNSRGPDTPDEIWLIEHDPVFTQGLAGKPEHLLDPHGIAVIQTERGGQITYHGPGQILAYLMLDIRRRSITVTKLVRTMEQAVIDCLAHYQIKAQCRPGAPGVYLGAGADNGAKIASLGLKVSRGRTFHGLALNVDMDLTPFTYINPCGLAGLQVLDMQSVIGSVNKLTVANDLASHLKAAIEELN